MPIWERAESTDSYHWNHWGKTLSKLIITRWEGRLLTALFSHKEALEIGLEESRSILGNIYIGKVNNIIKNLNSAFVDFGEGQTGYYNLSDNPVSIFSDGHSGKLKSGDEIVVQVEKEAVKAKEPVLTANLNFTGRYAVLTAAKNTIGFSSKILDKGWKDALRPKLEALVTEQAGVIVRTNAYRHEEELLKEVGLLLDTCRHVVETAKYRSCFSLLYEAEPEYLKSLQGCPEGTLTELVTDQKDVLYHLENYLALHNPGKTVKLRFYDDPMLSLTKLYSLETVLEQACQKRVWLKSGGYLIIEYTEAMTVIDVNTGKYSGRKSKEEAIRLTNLEAASEIARQLRLRNVSGIIIVDFIDMKSESDRELLLSAMRDAVKRDPVKTTVVDMTPLNLVELTRKKAKKPLWEQLPRKEKGDTKGL